MKIIVAITDPSGKNIAFVTDDLTTRTLEQVIDLVRQKLLQGVHLVTTHAGTYVRANRNETNADNLDLLSISASNFFEDLKNGARSEAARLYERLFANRLQSNSATKDLIYVDGHARAKKADVLSKFKSLSANIKAASKNAEIDPHILGAILIDEYVRIGPEDLMDVLGRFGVNTSVGIAQIKMDTAREVIADGYYKDAPRDISDNELYKLLSTEKTSIAFAAARIRMTIDHWKPFIDLSGRPEILGTLYSRGLSAPHRTPVSNARGDQIKAEFLPLAQEALK
jgi:hypothetical protein